ncbi:MAG: hypothetical protein UR61_C0018G0011 [candidate division WS6 bacterium GW2011_GWE1_34_7]|uniref:Fimbrial assembly family protein n=1 Tax=candidate division WS6 bacterium GW2011_GWE1_34_7 TaxID=1619093 RepID=A0A0G0BPI5_9BACT|nr:MAG: hypothetical protein UR61_C0018G0011 [candidate division WS6 bacterium GW2011_GWE1_34_7]
MNNTQTQNQNVAPMQNVSPAAPQTNNTQPTVNPTLAEPSKGPQAEGFNLIPAMSQEEKAKIKTKNTLNIGSILSIIALASVAIGIVSFNILSKAQLNSKKASLSKIEKTTVSKMDKIISNNAIVDRAVLYLQVKKDSFSHKKIIEFFTEIASKTEGITFRSMDISEDLTFEISGTGPSLERIARLWYLFGVHENIKSINLQSVSKSDTGVTFSFEGELNITNFINE